MARRIIPDIVHDQTMISVAPNDTVRSVARLMSDHQIGAVLVMEEERLVSIFTERDLALRVVATGLDPDVTPVGTVSTVHPDTLTPRATPREALTLMLNGHYRHVPVVDGSRVVGIVSIRDLYQTIMHSLEEDLIALAHRMIRG